MDTNKKFLLWLLTIAFGCTNSQENSDFNLVISKPNHIAVNQKTVVKIFSSNTDWNLLKAYFDCDSLREISIDSLTHSIVGCDKELFVNKDTVIIQFTPNEVGKNKFHNIKVLLKNSGNRYIIKDTSFHYVVNANESTASIAGW